MKNSIQRRVNRYFIIFFIIMILLLSTTKFLVSHFYVSYKFTIAENFLNNNDTTNEEKYAYLISNGFYVAKDMEELKYNTTYHIMQGNTLMKNELMGSICCSIVQGNKYITLLDSNNQVLGYATINEYILNDITNFLNIMLLLTIIIFVLYTLVLKKFISKTIIKRIEHIPASIEKNSDYEYKFDDEISNLFNELREQKKIIEKNTEDNKLLMKAISHELKSPIVNIESMLKMHKNGYLEYKNFEYVYNRSLIESQKLIKDIVKLVNFYDIDFFVGKEEIDLVLYLAEKINLNQEIKLKKLKVQYSGEYTFLVNRGYLDFICANIVSNIGKFSLENSTIEIFTVDNKLIIKNTVGNSNSKTSNLKGNEITKLFCEKINLTISYLVEDKIFTTILNKKV